MALGITDTSPDKRTGFTFRGREIVLSKTRGRPFTGLVKKGMEKGIYPEEKRIEAVTIYAATGDIPLVEELTSVPQKRFHEWKKEQWFRDLLQEIRDENNAKLDAKFTAIAEKALEQVDDRLEHGDFHITRDGEILRKPLSGKDLIFVGDKSLDKRQLLRGEPTSRSESVGGNLTVVNKLEELAKTFENLAKIGRKPQVIDVVDAEILPDAASAS